MNARGAWVLAVALVGCGGGAALRPQAPLRPTLSPALAALPVFVASVEARHTDGDCAKGLEAKTADALRAAIQAELAATGMQVVVDEGTAHRLRVEILIDLSYCSPGNGWVRGSTRLSVLGSGRLLDQQTYFVGESSFPEGFASQSMEWTMRPALASPAVEAYAQQQAPASETPTAPVGGSTPAPAAGCTKDTDCKGDRICERGACVTPH